MRLFDVVPKANDSQNEVRNNGTQPQREGRVSERADGAVGDHPDAASAALSETHSGKEVSP